MVLILGRGFPRMNLEGQTVMTNGLIVPLRREQSDSHDQRPNCTTPPRAVYKRTLLAAEWYNRIRAHGGVVPIAWCVLSLASTTSCLRERPKIDALTAGWNRYYGLTQTLTAEWYFGD